MKKFFISFLGTLAGIWFSLLLAMVGLIIVISAAAASSIGSSTTDIKKHSVLHVDLSGSILDRQPKLDFMSVVNGEDKDVQILSDITGSIIAAASDDRIDGILISCQGSAAGVAQRAAIVTALRKFKKEAPGKWVYAYGDMYSQGDYYIASSADSIYINPIGQVDIHGLSATTLFFHQLLQKIGVEVQVVKVGTYKSAVEPFILDNMSEPSREQQQLYLGNIWQTIASTIAEGRKVSVDTVNAWADNFIFTAPTESYVDMKIADVLAYHHEFDEMIAGLTECEKAKDVRYVSTADYAKTADINKKGDGKGATIAVLYACGDITDESGNGIVATDLVPQILDLAEEDDIDGLVMYVNSGGGSAFASEQIWEALEQYKSITGKPFYVSMGDYAASGGYYISCGADKIFAEPVTLTGSIGIFGMIPNAKRLMSEKLGINTGTVKTNANGNFPSLMEPMTPAQAAAMQSYVERGYDLFTKRCAEGRSMSQDSIKMIGEGRVWDGREALRLGLVDELGGLDAAIAAMAANLNVETYTVRTYPDVKQEWYAALIEAGNNIKASIVRDELGEMSTLYETIQRVKGMSTMQCRMDFVEVEL
ncbi:MAG: signal peptide peptidase SppA [Staphylococcus sp.]|nr:signal peptide peptidase SppA [Staphylococcus sp.]